VRSSVAAVRVTRFEEEGLCVRRRESVREDFDDERVVMVRWRLEEGERVRRNSSIKRQHIAKPTPLR